MEINNETTINNIRNSNVDDQKSQFMIKKTNESGTIPAVKTLNSNSGIVDSDKIKSDLKTAVAELNKYLKPITSGIEFSVDEGSGKTIVKLIDTETKEILRQFPTKQMIEISKDLTKVQGLLVSEKV
jgi:flagellar protein FlaG